MFHIITPYLIILDFESMHFSCIFILEMNFIHFYNFMGAWYFEPLKNCSRIYDDFSFFPLCHGVCQNIFCLFYPREHQHIKVIQILSSFPFYIIYIVMLLAIFQDRDYSDVQVKRRQLTWNNIKKQTLKLEIDRNSKQKELIYLAIVLNDIQIN